MSRWRWLRTGTADRPTPPVGASEAAASAAEPDSEPEAQSEDGVAWVLDGAVGVRNPTGRGRWPSLTLEPGSGVELYVNGARCGEQVVLRAEDAVELRVAEEEFPSVVEVQVSEDEMSAWVIVQPAERNSVTIPDVAPATQIRVSGQWRRESVPDGHLSADVQAALDRAGVCRGVDPEAVADAPSRLGVSVLAAQGRPPQPPRPARLWSALHGWVSHPAEARRESGVAPQDRPVVDIGQPIVQLTPGAAGVAGETVRGRALDPPPAWLPELVAGDGALLSPDALTIIAAGTGHPEVVVDDAAVFVAVHPEVQIPADVDDSTGDVAHAGDVWIGGDVHADRRVCATGSVEVRGRTVHACIEAGNSVRIQGGAAYTLLVAGGAGLVYAQTLPLCEQLLKTLGEGATPGAQGTGALRRAQPLAARIRPLLEQAEVALDTEAATLGQILRAVARQTGSDAARAQLEALARALNAGLPVMRRVLANPGRCFAQHLDSCRVEATGDVELGEAGALRSRVVTLGRLTSNGPFRGGSVLAMRGATFVSVGANRDMTTRVEVGEHASFRAGEVLPGTVVVRGATVREFHSPTRNVVIEG